MDITLSKLCAALIEAFAYFAAILCFFTGLLTVVNTVIKHQLEPAVGGIIAGVGRVWARLPRKVSGKGLGA